MKVGSVFLFIKKGFVNCVKFLKDFYFFNFKDFEDFIEEVFYDV